jgi:glycine reductase complex component B subunit alpha and beta
MPFSDLIGDCIVGGRELADGGRLSWPQADPDQRHGGRQNYATLGAMQLELAAFPVTRARFGAPGRYADGELTIDADAVRALVLSDPRVAAVELALAHPGESVRVLRTLDAVEPLHKPRAETRAFAGFNGPPRTVGDGLTHRLAGFTVVEVTDFPFPASGVQAFEEGVVEMSGPGARYSGCADRVNLLLVCTPGRAATNVDYDDAVRRAALRVADHLAALTVGATPAHVERFAFDARDTSRPRIAWLHQVRAQGPMVQTFLYGHELSGMVPTLLAPTELLDGALVSGNYKTGSKTPTYLHTRHSSLLALAARHGRDLDFVGVILARGHHENEFLKARSAQMVAKLARLLRADGVLATYEATGNTHIDFMLSVQALERAEIPTAAVVHEYGGPDGEDPPLVDYVPEAIALASSGGIDRRLALPAVARVVGGTHLAHRGEPAAGPLDLPIQELYAVTAEMNARGIVAVEY